MPLETPSSFFLEKLRLGGYASAAEAREDYEKYFDGIAAVERGEALGIIFRMRSDEKLAQPKQLLDLMPEGWFKDYLGLADSSESPMSFHFLCALALFSHLIGRKSWTSFNGTDVFAPESGFIVSPAGLARRSDAINAMIRVAEAAGASMLKGQPTPEALISYLSERPHTLMVATEAAALLNSAEYMQQIPQFMCQLLDCETTIELIRQKSCPTVHNATVNAILSAAPTWFESMPSSALGGGLLSRVILVFEHDKEKIVPFPEDIIAIDKLREAQAALGVEAREVTKDFKGILHFPATLKNRYASFYKECGNSQKNANTKMSHWYGRKATHFRKLLISFLCAMGKTPTVDGETFDAVEAILEHLERKMDFGYRHTTSDKYEKQRQVVLDHLDRLAEGAWIDRTTLFQRTSWVWRTAKELDEVLDVLGHDGLREIESRVNKTPGKRTKKEFRRVARSGV